MKRVKVEKMPAKELATVAIEALEQEKVLVFPTDTVYGLVADATSKKAVQKVFLIKGRKRGKPLPIFVKDIAMAKTLARVSPLQEAYMRKVWPGKVTLVLESRGKLPRETGTSKTIGLRIPKHPLLQKILEKAHIPLTGTSANLAGQPSLSAAKKVIRQFSMRRHRPDLVFDAGTLPKSRPSLVVDIKGATPKISRR